MKELARCIKYINVIVHNNRQ